MNSGIRIAPRFSLLVLAGMLMLCIAANAAIDPVIDISVRLSGDEIRGRIEALQTRNDVVAADKQLTIENLQTALARLDSAEAARKLTAEYAESLKQAPEKIARLQAQLESPDETVAESPEGKLDSAKSQLRMAALQINAVTLRAKQRELDTSLRTMIDRQVDARVELSDLRDQLESRSDPLPIDASQLLLESSQIKSDAVRQDLSARIEKTEQEILSLPTREAIAVAQRKVLSLALEQAEVDISDLGRRMDAQEQEDVRAKLERASAAVAQLQGNPEALVELAKETETYRQSMFNVANDLRKLWSTKDRLHGQLEEVAIARKNVDQILAFGRIGDEYGRVLREIARKLPSPTTQNRRITQRKNAIVDVRVDRFGSEQKLDEAGSGASAAKQFLGAKGIDESPELLALTQAQLKDRRESLIDLRTIRGRQIEALDELNQLQGELQQRSAQLKAMLDQRLLWLPNSAPINLAWFGQVMDGFTSLLSVENRAAILPAVKESFSAGALQLYVAMALIVSLLLGRGRLRSRLVKLAAPVGTRSDRFNLTLSALLVTILLAIPVPLAIGMSGSLFTQPYNSSSFPSTLGRGLINVGIVLFIVGLFRNMCRRHGLFAGHFGWDAVGVKRLGLALWFVSLALVPAVWLSSVARTNNDPLLSDGLGRLALFVISIALAIFTHRVFRPNGGAMTTHLEQKSLLWRTRFIWYWALMAIPLILAIVAMAGYSVSASELQGRMITTGWILLAIVIILQIAMRGVLVSGRQAAYKQAELRAEKRREEAFADSVGEGAGAGEGAPVLHEEPEIDVVTVSQQTRGLLRAAAGILLIMLLWSTWSSLIPALGIFNDVVLWSSVTTTDAGQVVNAVTLGHVLFSLALLVLTGFAARNIPGFLEVVVFHRFEIDSGTRYAYVTITRYTVLAVGFMIVLGQIGADWSKLQWIVAALGVGLGFGLQEIVANFVSGIIILFERPVRVGDLITIDDTVGTVSRIKIRAITITDPDNFEVLVPNKSFITGTVKNWSLTSPITRLVIKVGVAYGSDVARAQQLMLDVAAANEQVLESPNPVVLFLGFGDSALDLELRVFVGRIDQRLSTVNNLHIAVHDAFNEAGIQIPFPQRDLHLQSVPEGMQLRDETSVHSSKGAERLGKSDQPE